MKGREASWLDILEDGDRESLEMGRFFRWKILGKRRFLALGSFGSWRAWRWRLLQVLDFNRGEIGWSVAFPRLHAGSLGHADVKGGLGQGSAQELAGLDTAGWGKEELGEWQLQVLASHEGAAEGAPSSSGAGVSRGAGARHGDRVLVREPLPLLAASDSST